jgi:hypothetical protein
MGLLAAWSLAPDSVVLVQIAKWLVPESVLGGVCFPEEAINGEDSNTGHVLACYLSDLGFHANDF